MWLFTLVWATMTVGTSGLQFYQPTVIAGLGFTFVSLHALFHHAASLTRHRTIAKSQLLNIPTAVVAIAIIAITSYISDGARLPRPIIPLILLTIILACYSVLYVFPNNGGVYAATVLSVALSNSWYPMMWPWRVQTTNRATGAAFAIAFSNACGQIGFAAGPQIFQSKYAPHYTTPFAIAMTFVGVCILVTMWTWWETRETETQTRRIKKLRVQAAKMGQSVLDDVDVDADLKQTAVHQPVAKESSTVRG